MSYDIAIWTAAGFGIAALITALWLDDRRDRLASASLLDPLTCGNTIRESRNRRSAAWSVMALLARSRGPGLSRLVRTGASALAGPGADNGQSPPSPGDAPRSRAQAGGKPGSEPSTAHGPGRPASDWLDDLAEASKAAYLAKRDGPREPPERQVLEAVLVQGEIVPLTDVAPPAGPWLPPPRSGPWVPVRDGARVPCADTAWDREQAAWLRELLVMSREGYASLGEFAASRRPS